MSGDTPLDRFRALCGGVALVAPMYGSPAECAATLYGAAGGCAAQHRAPTGATR